MVEVAAGAVGADGEPPVVQRLGVVRVHPAAARAVDDLPVVSRRQTNALSPAKVTCELVEPWA